MRKLNYLFIFLGEIINIITFISIISLSLVVIYFKVIKLDLIISV